MERPSVSPRAGYWQELIDQQRLGALSVKQFCFEKNVLVASYYQWRRRLTVADDFRGTSSSSVSRRWNEADQNLFQINRESGTK